MTTEALAIEDFLSSPGCIFDVRSPSEFTHGRIPGAISLPLFDDSERAEIGKAYKQVGKACAIEIGLKYVGPKLVNFVSQAKNHQAHGLAKVHCWRGGMRSSSMAWLLKTAGLKTITLQGGYKTFRKWAMAQLCLPHRLIVLGGMTGSGKTVFLNKLKERGEQVLDLEELACHRGSTYGMLNRPSQPSTEQFENEIALQWSHFDPQRPIWIEDEGRMIGTCPLPKPLFERMRQAPLIVIERPLHERVNILMDEYGHVDPHQLIEATQRIYKRLGGAKTKEIIHAIQEKDLPKAIESVLKYYDSAYQYALSQRNQPYQRIKGANLSHHEWVEAILRGTEASRATIFS